MPTTGTPRRGREATEEGETAALEDARRGRASEETTTTTTTGATTTTATTAVKHDKLLVLDLNGLFIDRRMRRYRRGGRGAAAAAAAAAASDAEEATEPNVEDAVPTTEDEVVESARVGNYYVYDRPHMREFIAWAHTKFEVGVWSSAQERNTRKLVDYVWGEHRNKVAFVWGQERCLNVGVAPSDSPEGTTSRPIFLKELQKVWSLKKKTGLARFNETNTLLIDDSPYKAIRNPAHTVIHPRGFTAEELDTDEMLGKSGALRRYLEEMLESTSIPDFVRANPWQGGIITPEQEEEIVSAKAAYVAAKEKADALLLALRDDNEIDLDDI